MLRGAEGFGLKHHLRTDRLLTLSEDLPLVVGRGRHATADRAAARRGHRDQAPRPDHARARADADRRHRAGRRCQRSWTRRRSSRSTSGARSASAGAPAFVAVCELLHRRGIAGATVLLGVDGTAHGVRAARALLRAQRGGSDDDHRGRRRRADRRACCPSSARCCSRAAAHARARPRLQARRPAARAADVAARRPTSRAWPCGRS